MAEKILEKQVCQACGADVRLNAEFCYNCGSAVGNKFVKGNGKSQSNTLLRENISEDEDNTSKTTTNLDKKNLPIPIEKPNLPLTNEKNVENVKPLSKPQTKTKSAAELRQKNKLERKKSVEIRWEEPESAPNVWFITVTFILTLFAVGILFVMLYIR
jgi:zinc-ribbon domain